VIDGGQAQAQVETYSVAVATVANGTTEGYTFVPDQTIQAKSTSESAVTISGNQIKVAEVKKPDWNLIFAALLIPLTIGTVVAVRRHRSRLRPKIIDVSQRVLRSRPPMPEDKPRIIEIKQIEESEKRR
jgi:hypothetical protein